MGMDLTSQHAENLYRNLSGFNLELDKVVRDGNCFFKSVARQISAYLKGDNRQTEEHFRSLGIGKCEEETTAKLRHLFVNKVTENITDYENWMTAGSNNLETVAKFKESGFLPVKWVTFVQVPLPNSCGSQSLLLQLFQVRQPSHFYLTSSQLTHPCILYMITPHLGTTMLRKVDKNIPVFSLDVA